MGYKQSNLDLIEGFGSAVPGYYFFHAFFYTVGDRGQCEIIRARVAWFSVLIALLVSMIVQVACSIVPISLLVFVLLSTSLFLISSTIINSLDEAMWNKLTDLYSSSDLMDFTSACCSNESATFMYSQHYELSIALSFFIKSAMNADELNTDVYEGLFSVVMMARRFGWNPLMEPVDGTDVALFSGEKIEVQSKKRVEPYIGSIP